MEYDFDRIIDRHHTDSVKWDIFGDALPLWVADMDFSAPEPVIRALHERVGHGVFGYTTPPAALYEILQARLLELYDWRVDADAIVFLPGVMRGVNMAGRAVGRPGDGILIQPPVYYPFFDVPANNDRVPQLVEVPRVNGAYQIDYDAFENAITDRTSMFILCNPHNPIGRAWQRQELERVAEICLRHGIVICSDEIHCDLVLPGNRHLPIASLAPEIAEQSVTVFAPSKTYNLPGLACSFMVIQNPDLRKRVEAAGAGLVHGSNLMGYTAALAAYREGGPWLKALLAYLDANADFLVDFVSRRLSGLRVVKPEATYLAWIDCRDAGIGENPHEFFLKQAQVALNDGAKFGPGGEGFVRLNFGCPRATLLDALEQMEKALQTV